jgi:hypothetical protein
MKGVKVKEYLLVIYVVAFIVLFAYTDYLLRSSNNHDQHLSAGETGRYLFISLFILAAITPIFDYESGRTKTLGYVIVALASLGLAVIL